MVLCSECGKENPENSRYCSDCGKPIVNSKINQKEQYVEVKDTHKTADESKYKTEITVGWLGVLFFMPLGFIMGIVLLTKEEKKARNNGIAQVVISLVWGYIILMIYSHG